MRSILRTMAMAGLLAIGSSSGLGVSTARACDHGPGGSYGRTASWGYRAEFGLPGPARYVDIPDSNRCPICHPAPPICEPPPCESGGFVVRQSRRVTYGDYGREAYFTGDSSPQALPAYPERYGAMQEDQATYPTPQAAMPAMKDSPVVTASFGPDGESITQWFARAWFSVRPGTSVLRDRTA